MSFIGLFRTDVQVTDKPIPYKDIIFLLEVTSLKPVKYNILKSCDLLISLIMSGQITKIIKETHRGKKIASTQRKVSTKKAKTSKLVENKKGDIMEVKGTPV